MTISISTKQAPDLIMRVLKAGLCPMLHGSPSTAKSSIIHQIAKENKLKVIDLRLSQMDVTDLCGLPYFNKDHTKSSYIPPEYFPLEGDEIPEGYRGWILFLDELSAASPAIQVASYKIILDRLVGQANLHKKVAVVAAGNKATDKAVTHRMSTALQSRLLHFDIDLLAKDWIEWAIENKIDYRIIAYIGFKPSALNQFNPDHSDYTYACARTWEFTSKLIINELTLPHTLLPLLTAGLGEGAGREFNAYCQVFDKLPTFDEIAARPKDIDVPTEPSTCYAITSMIAARMDKSNVDSLMEFVNRLPIEFAIITLQQSLRGNVGLLQTKGIKDWMKVHSESLFSD